MQRILITGGSGFLGHTLTKMLVGKYKVFSAYNKNLIKVNGCIHSHLDITNYQEVRSVFGDIKPDLVIHAAALANVEKCEEDPYLAWNINALGTGNIAWGCDNIKAKLVYISTDSVYNGERINHSEKEKTKPINSYAKTKLEGEKATLNTNIVIRTAFFGDKGLAEWVASNLKMGRDIHMFTDALFSPIFTEDLGNIIIKMWENNLKGIYNVGSGDSCSKYEFGISVAKAFGIDDKLITPVMVDTVKSRIPRPKSLSLNVSKVEYDLGIKMPTVMEGINRFKDNYGRN